MSDRIIQGFRAHQYEDVTSLAKASDVVEILPVEGDPPARYIISVRAKGLIQGKADRIMEADRCDIMIWLPDDYLRRAEAVQVLTYLGPSRRPWHPNIRPPYICMNIRPGTPLVDLTYACFSLWTWDLYYTGDNGLNPAASQWARNQPPGRFPVDRRPLRRRHVKLKISVAEGVAAT